MYNVHVHVCVGFKVQLGLGFNPICILTGLFGADRREILHGCQDKCKEYCYNLFLPENCLFIMLLCKLDA